MATYTCPVCDRESHELPSQAEANQLLDVHLRLAHGSPRRASDPRPAGATPPPGRRGRRR